MSAEGRLQGLGWCQENCQRTRRSALSIFVSLLLRRWLGDYPEGCQIFSVSGIYGWYGQTFPLAIAPTAFATSPDVVLSIEFLNESINEMFGT